MHRFSLHVSHHFALGGWYHASVRIIESNINLLINHTLYMAMAMCQNNLHSSVFEVEHGIPERKGTSMWPTAVLQQVLA